MRKCKIVYLVVFLDTSSDPPQFLEAGIYSEKSPTGNGRPFVVLEGCGDTYEKAQAAIVSEVRSREDLRGLRRYVSNKRGHLL